MEYIFDKKQGIFKPTKKVEHRDSEYNQSGFEMLYSMQRKHFRYRGRHRFLLSALDRYNPRGSSPWCAVDLGGGVGGWVQYVANRRPKQFSSLALADSSEYALTMAGKVLPANTERYQIDLLNLGWESKWDCAFLLDVIEHLPEDVEAMRQA